MSADILNIRFKPFPVAAVGVVIFAAALFTAWMGWAALDADWHPQGAGYNPINREILDFLPGWVRGPLLIVVAAVVLVYDFVAVRRFLGGQPAFIVDNAGITTNHLFRKTVKWTDLTGIVAEFEQSGRRQSINSLTFHGYKGGASRTKPQALFKFFPWLMDYQPGELEDLIHRFRPDLDVPWSKAQTG